MKTLGISFGYHDSSASLVIDGKVVCASSEERFTRQKHDSYFPKFAIDYCLKSGGVGLEEIDQVVFHEDPHSKFSRILISAISGFPHTRREFVNSIKSWMGQKFWALQTIALRLRVPSRKIRYLSHHFSHAAHAFLGSGFDKAGILIVDAVGDWSCSALYSASWENGKPAINPVLEIPFPNSLGLVYSAFTSHLGYSPNDSECTTMALAAFGRPVYADGIRKIIPDLGDGIYSVDTRYFHFTDFYKGAVTQKFIDTFGSARDARVELPFSCFSQEKISADAQRYADLACSVQLVLEERLISLAKRLKREVGSENLCIGGGVAMNCVATAKLLESGIFKNIYIPPDPGDGGTSIGTAMFVNATESSSGAHPYLPALGGEMNPESIIEIIEGADPKRWIPFRAPGNDRTEVKWRYMNCASAEESNEKIAGFLAERKIVGICRGNYEFGPRALGQRSILTRPDDVATALRLSQKVKHRSLYRPYALSVTEEGADLLFNIPKEQKKFYRWMQHSVQVPENKRLQTRAALHVDGTTRPQIVYKSENEDFHDLLKKVEEQTGLPAVLNTSFNATGYPLVRSAVEALAMFARTNMDVLAIEKLVVWKEE